jgi:REP element-mobilizing transposase RayT
MNGPDKLTTGLHTRGALPHLKREGASYFVVFRLYGTLPREVILRLKREREAILREAEAHNRPLSWREQKDLFNWYSERVDAYLDKGIGVAWLRRPDIAGLVAGSLRFFDRQRYDLHAWVVMPNHVHVVVRPERPYTLSSILKSWKTYTAVQANRLLGRTGEPFWQNESYDHCCHDEEDRAKCCEYTILNPVNAGLCQRPELWPWSSAFVGQTSGLPVGGASGSVEQPSRVGNETGLQSKPELADQRSAPQRKDT